MADRGAGCPAELVVKDGIADAFLQQILTRPKEYSVIATLNLNGDYISDALAAQVGGIGIAPGANINYQTGQRSSRPPTAPRRNTPARTRSIRAPSFSPARSCSAISAGARPPT